MFENVTTHYQTLEIWIGHNATRYHNFNVLPYALPHALPYIFSHLSMGWCYLQSVTTTSTDYHRRYCTFYLSLAWFGAVSTVLPRSQTYNKNVY